MEPEGHSPEGSMGRRAFTSMVDICGTRYDNGITEVHWRIDRLNVYIGVRRFVSIHADQFIGGIAIILPAFATNQLCTITAHCEPHAMRGCTHGDNGHGYRQEQDKNSVFFMTILQFYTL